MQVALFEETQDSQESMQETPTPANFPKSNFRPAQPPATTFGSNIVGGGARTSSEEGNNKFKTRGGLGLGGGRTSITVGAAKEKEDLEKDDEVEPQEPDEDDNDDEQGSMMPPPPLPPSSGRKAGLASLFLPSPTQPRYEKSESEFATSSTSSTSRNEPSFKFNALDKRQTSIERKSIGEVNDLSGTEGKMELDEERELPAKVKKRSKSAGAGGAGEVGGEKAPKRKRKSSSKNSVPRPSHETLEPQSSQLDELQMTEEISYTFDPLTPVPSLFPGPVPHVQQAKALMNASLDEGHINKWDDCTIQEWEAGGAELLERFGELLQRLVGLVKRKAERNNELRSKMEKHKDILKKRREDIDQTSRNLKKWGGKI